MRDSKIGPDTGFITAKRKKITYLNSGRLEWWNRVPMMKDKIENV